MLNKVCKINDVINLTTEILKTYDIEEISNIKTNDQNKILVNMYNFYDDNTINIFLMYVFLISNFINKNLNNNYNNVNNMSCTINMTNCQIELKLLHLFNKIKIYGNDKSLHIFYINNCSTLENNKENIKILKNDLLDIVPNTDIIINNIQTGGISNQLFKYIDYNYIFDHILNCFKKNKDLKLYALLTPQNIEKTYNNLNKELFQKLNVYIKRVFHRHRDNISTFIFISKYDMEKIDENLKDSLNYDDIDDLYLSKIKELYLFLNSSKNQKILNYLKKYI